MAIRICTLMYQEDISRNGALGVGRIKDKGSSFLAEWIWRFGREETSLWKIVICAKYGVVHRTLLWNWKGTKAGSPFIKTVGSLFREGSRVHNIIDKGFRVVVGNEERLKLWEDIVWDSVPLKNVFPRIFALANIKYGRLKDFGKWDGRKWVWEVALRRLIFDWENDQ
ncbi:hypothetical protein Dsin_015139 [Dipteronia sinensis]|uniref:Reverse transcriptase zinc-binding domain-containing protein n=1 Tax=Dipteronia sinensis TaxID=43782 RepID=A0AAE0EAQ0_9ROSI|nr:hypothetical protein Dsin_015139 [Dipteronia sinensis]